jgi:aminocarboxymuconate-semialdehyde decarboxylase
MAATSITKISVACGRGWRTWTCSCCCIRRACRSEWSGSATIFLNNLIAYPTDTTIAAARLLFGGILRNYPSLECCLAHGGAFLPYQIGRLDRGFAAHPACKIRISLPPSDHLRSFYYDTLTHHTQALSYLISLVGSDRILFGSDYPFEMVDKAGPAGLQQVSGLTAAEREAILGGNAETLFRNAADTTYKPVSG